LKKRSRTSRDRTSKWKTRLKNRRRRVLIQRRSLMMMMKLPRRNKIQKKRNLIRMRAKIPKIRRQLMK